MGLHQEIITPELKTTSRVVAEKFGKRHDNIIQRIENQMKDLPDDFCRLNFKEANHLDAQGKPRPHYEMTRDGFTMIVMGMTGKAAMEWKVRFIEAFNAMENQIKNKSIADNPIPIPFQVDEPLTNREWLGLIRETRLANGPTAAQLVYAQSPFSEYLPDPNEDVQAGSSSNETETPEAVRNHLGRPMTIPEKAILIALHKATQRIGVNSKSTAELAALTGLTNQEAQDATVALSAFDMIRNHVYHKRKWQVSEIGGRALHEIEMQSNGRSK